MTTMKAMLGRSFIAWFEISLIRFEHVLIGPILIAVCACSDGYEEGVTAAEFDLAARRPSVVTLGDQGGVDDPYFRWWVDEVTGLPLRPTWVCGTQPNSEFPERRDGYNARIREAAANGELDYADCRGLAERGVALLRGVGDFRELLRSEVVTQGVSIARASSFHVSLVRTTPPSSGSLHISALETHRIEYADSPPLVALRVVMRFGSSNDGIAHVVYVVHVPTLQIIGKAIRAR